MDADVYYYINGEFNRTTFLTTTYSDPISANGSWYYQNPDGTKFYFHQDKTSWLEESRTYEEEEHGAWKQPERRYDDKPPKNRASEAAPAYERSPLKKDTPGIDSMVKKDVGLKDSFRDVKTSESIVLPKDLRRGIYRQALL